MRGGYKFVRDEYEFRGGMRIREGGLFRCCVGWLECELKAAKHFGEQPPKDGEKMGPSECCGTRFVYENGAWSWDHDEGKEA